MVGGARDDLGELRLQRGPLLGADSREADLFVLRRVRPRRPML